MEFEWSLNGVGHELQHEIVSSAQSVTEICGWGLFCSSSQ